MEQKILWDLYCFQCCLQFEKKSIYDLHLSIIHNHKNRIETLIKNEPEDIELLPDSRIIQPTQKEEPAFIKKATTINKGKKQFNCDFCEKSFKTKYSCTIHIASVHEGKKPFQCETCDFKSSQKGDLHEHVISVHEGNKPFQCEICDHRSSKKEA